MAKPRDRRPRKSDPAPNGDAYELALRAQAVASTTQIEAMRTALEESANIRERALADAEGIVSMARSIAEAEAAAIVAEAAKEAERIRAEAVREGKRLRAEASRSGRRKRGRGAEELTPEDARAFVEFGPGICAAEVGTGATEPTEPEYFYGDGDPSVPAAREDDTETNFWGLTDQPRARSGRRGDKPPKRSRRS